ncbi:hypothetical protein PA598K_04466 [Paenibacillus sp. 598K]|nr:hypothetical protein PA598K_04466 [Paenibacillus sp. 598K]
MRALFPELADATLRGIQLGSSNQYPPSHEPIWTLDWEMAQESSSWGYSIWVDALSGDVLSYSLPRFEANGSVEYPPSVDRAEAEQIGLAFVKKAAPSLERVELVPLDDRSFRQPGRGLFGAVSYNLGYQIRINGVQSNLEALNIEVDGEGVVRNFHYTRYQGEYPKATAALKADEALAKTRAMLELELAYQNENLFSYYMERPSDKWNLGYVPVTGLMALDAKTGEAVVELEAPFGAPEPLPASTQVYQPHRGAPLTEQQARARVTQLNVIPEGYEPDQGYQQSGDSKLKVWELTWSRGDSGPSLYYDEISATVDASTGKILGIRNYGELFNRQSAEGRKLASITEAEARVEAIRLIHQLYPNAASELRLTAPTDGEAAEQDGQFIYAFPRYYGDHPIQYHTIQLNLGADGRIVSYSNTGESNAELAAKLEALKPKVSAEEARATYAEALSVELRYVSKGGMSLQGPVSQPEAVLAYVPTAGDRGYGSYVDAITGELKAIYPDLNGTETSGEAQDIEGHWAQAQLETLIGAGALTPDADGLVHPNAELTRGEWLQMIAKAIYGDYEMYAGMYNERGGLFADIDADSPYAVPVSLFVGNGWLERNPTGELQPDQALTRDHLAELLAHLLNYDKLAGFMQRDVTVNGLADSAAIRNKGAVAIVTSLGLLQTTDGRFHPERAVTKAQAATVIMRLVELQGKTDSPLFR